MNNIIYDEYVILFNKIEMKYTTYNYKITIVKLLININEF